MLPWQQHFEGHALPKFDFLAYFVNLVGLWCLESSILVTLSTIVSDNYNVWDFFSQSVTSSMTSCITSLVYQFIFDFLMFCISCFCLFDIFRSYLLIYFKDIHKIDYNLHVLCNTSPTSRFPFHISLNPIFHCNTRHSYDCNGLKFEFAVWHIDQVFLIKNI